MNELTGKLKEVFLSAAPVVLIVLTLHFTLCPLEEPVLWAFLIGSLLVTVGLTLFLLGIDQGLEPIGHDMGSAITHMNSYGAIVTLSLVLGFFISYAEPDLHILARQVDSVTAGRLNRTLLVTAVSAGIGVLMTAGMLRIVKSVRLKYVFAGAYGLIFILSVFSSPDYLAIAFDASGATTGAITVPFMLALAGGFSAMKKSSRRSEADSFGLVGIASSGAVIGVLTAGLLSDGAGLQGALPTAAPVEEIQSGAFLSGAADIARESFLTLLPILAAYVIFQIFFFRHKRRRVLNTARGMLLTYVGLVIFLLGVNGGFMAVGTQLGVRLAALDSKLPLLLVALLLGLSTVLAEPAVHVLTHQVEEVTGGSVRRTLVLVFLSAAVGASIFMSALRIITPGIKLWMYLLPGFGLAVLLAFFVPDLFTGIAFDAGGVASGPMTATFSLAFVQGLAAQVQTADLVADGFGMIAVVAMMPIVAIELLGVLYQAKARTAERKKRRSNRSDG